MSEHHKSVHKNITYEKAFNEILEYFNYDKDKTIKWYMTKNPLLGNISPFEMIKNGNGQKLMKWIRGQLQGNFS